MLTGGGDCPGLNAVIRAVVRSGISEYGDEVIGFRDGWRGVLDGDTVPLDVTGWQARRGEQVSLRFVMLHVIQEYARHNGHADLIREGIDGVTGV